jgi:acetyltransferase-like isoleucine patch superfamily enzyme
MDWTKPIQLTVNGSRDPFRRLTLFFGHYDLRVYMNPTAYIDVGAGSLGLVANLTNVPEQAGSLGSIGRCCEAAPTAQIFVRGEHAHQKPVNICFAGMPLLGPRFSEEALLPLKPVAVGNGVVLSAGARVMSGVPVGDGAVIGAAAVLTKAAEPLGIYAGVPAKKLSARPSFAPWWDFSVPYLMANQQELQQLATIPAGHEIRPARPRFVLRNENTGAGIDLAGLVGPDDQIEPFSRAPETVRWYVQQFMESDNPMWWADCWA